MTSRKSQPAWPCLPIPESSSWNVFDTRPTSPSRWKPAISLPCNSQTSFPHLSTANRFSNCSSANTRWSSATPMRKSTLRPLTPGLPSGSLHHEERLDFSRVVTFNLDEYLGLPANHPQSFRHFMQQNFFAHVNVTPGNIHIPDGSIKGEYQQYCASYEEAIRKAGGIDLQVLGIGRNGHVGFNEPTSSLGAQPRFKFFTKRPS